MGWAAPTRYVIDPTQTTVRVIGHAASHQFIGITHSLQGRLAFDPEQRLLLEPAEVRIPVKSLYTGNYLRDRDMWAMFEAKQFPEIRVVVTRITRLPEEAGTPNVERYRLESRVTVRASEQPVTFDVVAHVSATALEVSGKVPLTTTMFELKPPSPFGLLRVNEDVLVEVTIRWNASR